MFFFPTISAKNHLRSLAFNDGSRISSNEWNANSSRNKTKVCSKESIPKNLAISLPPNSNTINSDHEREHHTNEKQKIWQLFVFELNLNCCPSSLPFALPCVWLGPSTSWAHSKLCMRPFPRDWSHIFGIMFWFRFLSHLCEEEPISVFSPNDPAALSALPNWQQHWPCVAQQMPHLPGESEMPFDLEYELEHPHPFPIQLLTPGSQTLLFWPAWPANQLEPLKPKCFKGKRLLTKNKTTNNWFLQYCHPWKSVSYSRQLR